MSLLLLAKASHFVHCKRNTRVILFSDKLTKVFIKLSDLKNKYYWGEFFLRCIGMLILQFGSVRFSFDPTVLRNE